MTSLESKQGPRAQNVSVTDDALVVDLVDGRTLTVSVPWYPRLSQADAEERADWELVGSGQGIHWPKLDEDIMVNHLIEGRRSAESRDSLAKWLLGRARAIR